VGVLSTHYRVPRLPADSDLHVLDLLARQAADWIERTHAEEALQGAKEAAEQANRIKDQFLATASHELRTPVSAILIWSRLLAEGAVKGDDMLSAFRSILNAAESQNRLIGDLLDVSRMSSGKLRLEARGIELAAAVRNAVDMMRPEAAAKMVHFQFQDSGAPLVIWGDPDRLRQVFWNLANNAVKFTPSGGSVEVAIERGQDRARITVKDTGMGINPDFLPYVFDKFRQMDGTSSRAHGGLGLGLAIVQELVQLHGGEVRAESAGEGQGATFIVELPMPLQAMVGGNEPAVQTREPGISADVSKPLAGLMVLLVEDESLTREALSSALKHSGARVTAVDSAAEARRVLMEVGSVRQAQDRPDVLISDIGLPDEDGYALMRSIRLAEAERADTPLPALALTAYARPQDRDLAVAAGFDAYATKPIGPADLVATVMRVSTRSAGR
jgi:signal transduction histidine kinase/AmiR/NasT family two-component response regulator